MKISYQNNIFNNDFHNFNAFLTNFNRFGDFKACSNDPFSDVLCHLEATHLTFNGSQLTGFSMIWVFTKRPPQADFNFSLNVNVNITVVSFISSSSRETIFHNFLLHWIDLIIFKIMKDECACKAALFKTISQILLFLIFFFYVFLNHKRDMGLTYLLIAFDFLQLHLHLPSRQKTYLKKKIQFLH